MTTDLNQTPRLLPRNRGTALALDRESLLVVHKTLAVLKDEIEQALLDITALN